MLSGARIAFDTAARMVDTQGSSILVEDGPTGGFHGADPSHRNAVDLIMIKIPQQESNRKICFSQGKPCVYRPEDKPNVIRTEWPNGTVDEVDFTRGN